MKEEKEFIQWQNLGGKIYGIGNTQEQLKGGFYEPSYDDRNNPCLKSIEVEMSVLGILIAKGITLKEVVSINFVNF